MSFEGESVWMTKPTDRFILRWIKVHLSAPVTVTIVRFGWIRPWMITIVSMALGIVSGAFFATGFGFWAGVFSAASQIFDGVDGQLARLTGRATKYGGFLDSVLDRYTDGFLVMGLAVFCFKNNADLGVGLLAVLGAMAVIGSGLISYTTCRAENLGLDLGPPTLASKGSRTAVVAISGLLSPFSVSIPLAAMVYLAFHTSAVVALRIYRASKQKSW